MATTTTTTPTYGTMLTWTNQTLLWSDQLVGLREWQASYDIISYALAVGETVDLVEGVEKGPQIAKAEVFAFAETYAKSVDLNKDEVIDIAEARAMLFGQYFAESVSIGDAPDKLFGKCISETFVFAEANAKSVGLNKDEAIVIAESFLNSVGYIRDFAETIAVAEAVANSFGLKKFEAFAVVDAWRRQGDMVISDMLLMGAGNVTMEDFIDFLSYGNVPGYEKWRDFIPGDYEYREAMFRVVLESKNADRGLLTNLQATVDVPDLIDRGSATVTDGSVGTFVTYNRTFHIVPEITLAARGGIGNPIAPEFNGMPTKVGFGVRLRDTVTGAYVTGSFTWAAHGY